MNRAELLKFDGISRSVLERRIVALVRVYDAAAELVAADDACNDAKTPPEVLPIEEQYERAWEALRAALSGDV